MRESFLSTAMNRHGDAVYRLALCRLQNFSDAEDVFQDTFLQLLQEDNAPYWEEERLKAWLLRVAGNLSKNRLDYNARRSTDELKEELAAQGREKLKKLLKEAYDFEGTV